MVPSGPARSAGEAHPGTQPFLSRSPLGPPIPGGQGQHPLSHHSLALPRPTSHCDPVVLQVLTSSMEEEVGSARAHHSVLDLFRVPTLRRRSCCLFVIWYAIPLTPWTRSCREGGAPAGFLGCISGWDRQLLREAEVLAGRDRACGQMWPAGCSCRKPAGPGSGGSAGPGRAKGHSGCRGPLMAPPYSPRAGGHRPTPLSNPVR